MPPLGDFIAVKGNVCESSTSAKGVIASRKLVPGKLIKRRSLKKCFLKENCNIEVFNKILLSFITIKIAYIMKGIFRNKIKN